MIQYHGLKNGFFSIFERVKKMMRNRKIYFLNINSFFGFPFFKKIGSRSGLFSRELSIN